MDCDFAVSLLRKHMFFILMLVTYFDDVKKIGKDNLAVPFSERLFVYFGFIFLPILLGLIEVLVR